MAFGKFNLGRGFGLSPLGGVTRIADPGALFAQGQLGAWWDFSSTGTDKGFTASTGGSGSGIADGLTAALWIGQRTSGALSLGSELVTNFDFSAGSLTGWTDASTSPSTVTYNAGSALYTVSGANTARLRQSLTVVVGKTYAVAYSKTASNVALSIGTSAGGSEYFSTSGLASETRYIVATSTTLWISTTCTVDASRLFSVSIKEVSGRAAKQGTSSLRPTYRTASLGYIDFDGIDDVLGATFPASFTGDVVWLKSDGSISQLTGQSITTTFNLPTDDMKHCVIRQTLSGSELAALRAWLLRQPFA